MEVVKVTREAIKDRLQNIFIDVFDDESIKIWDEMSAADLDEWDSLMHITLVVATEKEFKVKLNVVEVSELKNVGEMIDLLFKRATL
jgi:acyl carrier protein